MKSEQEVGGGGGAKIWMPVEPWQENTLIDVSSMGLRDFLHLCDLLENGHLIIPKHAKDIGHFKNARLRQSYSRLRWKIRRVFLPINTRQN